MCIFICFHLCSLVESWTTQFLKQVPIDPVKETEQIKPVETSTASVQIPSIPVAPKPNPALAAVMNVSEAAVESPLTRAKRIDSQNTWREQQLSKFFVSKTEVLKSAMETLKVVKEDERASKIHVAPPSQSSERTSAMSVTEAAPAPPKISEVAMEKPLEIKDTKYILVQAKEEIAPIAPVFDSPRLSGPVRVASPKKTHSIPHNSPEKVLKRESYQDVFKVVSPFKTKKESLLSKDSVIETEPTFLDSFEAPMLDDTVIPDETIQPTSKDSDVFDSKLPQKREPSASSLSLEEKLKRQRLKERQEQAIAKRNMLIKKAQDFKAKVNFILYRQTFN